MDGMVSDDERRPVRDKIRDAEATCVALSAALEKVGIVLPSLRVDTASYVDVHPQARIYLGGCSTDTARRLAAALGPDGRAEVP
ncbi:hypothetical protein [Streptomyces sp. TS71-3]|uniref:hypothetical protein n=1 Tax=Streptomyces sp. TS71-3 TaxID=2733862 RepID=UPI001B00A814|nr:hypothetical protein [Streptomyces sp. TS71-3]GHJ36621.1 hypothetical protein Sm713_22300 [Streptomyces sp. TS71-3]